MPATCWPHGRRAGMAPPACFCARAPRSKVTARRQTGVLEDAARRRWYVSARPTRILAQARATISTRSRHPRDACEHPPVAACTLPTHCASCRLPR
eukprot:5223303-Prymnesium_polylepis.1